MSLAPAPSPFVCKKLDALGAPWTPDELRDSHARGLMLPGRKVWDLWSSYGYPLDLAIETAKHHGVTINLRQFFECWERERG